MTPAQNAAATTLQNAIDAAMAVGDSGDGNYDRVLAAKAAGMCAAILIREPNWTGFVDPANGLITWSNNHPPH